MQNKERKAEEYQMQGYYCQDDMKVKEGVEAKWYTNTD
jgi:hypothetical protein